MVFSSVTFLFLFLPVVLGSYLLLMLPPMKPKWAHFRLRLANAWLLLTSLFFYTWGEGMLVLVMLGSTCLDYCCALAMTRGWSDPDGPKCLPPDRTRSRSQKFALTASLAGNLALLGFFKYSNFGMENARQFLDSIGLRGEAWPNWNVILPMGISFYTFQSISYTIDVYRGRVAATRNFLDFACYVTMFPQLVAGPIVRYADVARQLVERKLSEPLFISGVKRFVFGLGKKVLIANTVAVPADLIFGLPASELTTPLAWFGAISYTLQIYFDFSGYSDMAIGLGRMFGFTFPENFNYPYVAKSVREFWRRWHISLSTWFRDYLYIPLGGNKGSEARTMRNLIVVFLLCGFWHGAAWTFIVWGAWHGFFLALERTRFGSYLERSSDLLQHIYLLTVTVFGFVIFRAENLPHVLSFIGAMLGLIQVQAPGAVFEEIYNRSLLIVFPLALLLSTPFVHILKRRKDAILAGARSVILRYSGEFLSGLLRIAVYALILLACAASLSAETHNPFIYFRF